jgi:hypothetical protein
MCSPADASKIRVEAGQWMQRGKMFTSVDIANSLKQRGDWVRNRDVADFLRTNVVNMAPQYGFKYTTTTIDVKLPNGSNTEATLYHVSGTNAATYTKTNQKAMSPDEAKTDSPPKAAAGGLSPDYDVEGDDPGRFVLGATALKPFEPRPTQVVNITIENLSIEHMTLIVTPGEVRLDEDFTEEFDEED